MIRLKVNRTLMPTITNLQKQLFQLSKTTFNGTSLFATTTEMYGGNAVKFSGNRESEENI